jgi:hypothetical protein
VNTENTTGWELVRNSQALLDTFGEYPSFHDAFITSFCLRLARVSPESLDDGIKRKSFDLELEILHDPYGPRYAGNTPWNLVSLRLVDIRNADIDVNRMRDGSWVQDISLSRDSDGFIRFDLEPSTGLDVRVTCREAVIDTITSYHRDER